MIGALMAAMRSRKAWARLWSGPGRGLMKAMRGLGGWWRALRRVMPRGMVEGVVLVGGMGLWSSGVGRASQLSWVMPEVFGGWWVVEARHL